MRVNPRRVVPIRLQGLDRAWHEPGIRGGILQQLLDRGIEALAQQAEQLAVVFEAEAEHLVGRRFRQTCNPD